MHKLQQIEVNSNHKYCCINYLQRISGCNDEKGEGKGLGESHIKNWLRLMRMYLDRTHWMVQKYGNQIRFVRMHSPSIFINTIYVHPHIFGMKRVIVVIMVMEYKNYTNVFQF